jgi:hypothetical protein
MGALVSEKFVIGQDVGKTPHKSINHHINCSIRQLSGTLEEKY